MIRSNTLSCLALAGAFSLASLACTPQDPPGTVKLTMSNKTLPGKPAVTFDDQSISVEELNKRFSEMNPYARMRFQTAESKKEYVDQLVRSELLAKEAVKRGLQNEPAVVEALKQVMVRELLKKELDEQKPPLPPNAVSDYYEKHHADYVKPAMVRLSDIFFTKDHKAKAEATLKQALALGQHDYAGFAKLAKENSENPELKAVDGDMHFLSEDELGQKYGPELVTAQATLANVGQTADKLVETKDGYHIIKLAGRQVALNLELDKVKASIEASLQNEARQQRYKDFVEGLRKNANVKIDEAALATVVIDSKPPPPGAAGPGMGGPMAPGMPMAPQGMMPGQGPQMRVMPGGQPGQPGMNQPPPMLRQPPAPSNAPTK